MIHSKLPTIYIGYDPREELYARVLKKSIEDNTKTKFNIVPLVQKELRRSGLYFRTHDGSNRIDSFDGKPFSTEFSFTRFLVPFLNQFSGLALFMDCDMYVRSDISEVFDVYGQNKDAAISCVHHNYSPVEKKKMDDQVQTVYFRKNWSSFMLWNCSHPAVKQLTVHDVSTKPGSWLHSFDFIDNYDGYDHTGKIHTEWNWLDGHSSEDIQAKNVHFTTGGPFYPNWVPQRPADAVYAEEWKSLAKAFL